MICVHNVVAASAVVGLNGKEGHVIRQTILPMIYYALTAGSIGYMFIYGVGFNAGTLIAAAIALTAVYIIATNRKYDRPISSGKSSSM